MAILNNNPLVGASGNQGGYNINNSLRFRSSASAYLSRTPASAGNRKTWTWSAWIKLGTISVNMGTLLGVQGQTAIYLNDGTYSSFRVNGAAGSDLITSLMPRDPSAWYHLVVACDTTQATDTNRLKIYVNGVQQTAFQAGATYPTLNGDTYFNSTSAHYIGRRVWNGDQQYDGYIAEQYLIDGSQKAASDFGETDTTTGVWKPKAYTGTYGTNGFYLNFGNTTSTTTLGFDSSPNGNNWTTNNISLTAGTTYDAMTDVPTNTSATAANYAVLNPLDNPSSSNSLSNANLTASTAGASGWRGIRATMAFPTTGKWYYEVTLTSGTNNLFLGIVSIAANGVYHDHADTFAVRMSDCALDPSGATATGTQAGYAVGDIFGVAIDCSTPTVQFYKNGALNVTYTSPTFDPSKTYFPCFLGNDTGASATHNFNFGQRPFSYTPPTGFVALNTFNLPTPTILQGNKYMDATLYTGDGATTKSITNASGFKPDLIWIKGRSNTGSNLLQDSNRGFGTATKLSSNSTNAENNASADATDPIYGYITAANSNGFTVNVGTTPAQTNNNGVTYVGWQWQAGQGTTSSNTSGSITSTVSVNATAGFSVVTYTGNGTGGATVGHGLGVTPSFIIIKRRSSADNWYVYHSSVITAGSTNKSGLLLNTTGATFTNASATTLTSNSSSTFGVGTDGAVNNNTSTYVAYCWAEIAGFSKFGSYTGNGSTDGPFVFTNFRPKFVLIKYSSGVENWAIWDTSRNTYNVMDTILRPDSSAADTSASTQNIDFVSNGFKIRGTDGKLNTSSGTYIYMAFAENPFKNSLAR